MLIVITDGDWSSPDSCDQVIATMRSQGVMTGLVYLEDKDLNPYFKTFNEEGERVLNAHACEAFEKLTNPRDILSFAKTLAKLSRNRLLSM